YKPTQGVAQQALTGSATVIIGGIADGMKSVWAPVLIICVGMLSAFGFANGFNFVEPEYFALGLYGIGIAAVGMLSTLGITLATDAYGPIADNAGGNAEMSGLDPIVRERTDALDSLGNTTAATGKGFAIGSAALTALALLAAYMESVRDGFDMWATDNSAITAEAEPGLYKLNNQLLVKVDEDKSRTSYLLFPEATRTAAWSDLEAKSGASVGISGALLDGSKKESRPELVLTSGEGGSTTTTLEAVALESMTIPDFARYYDASLMNPKILVGIFIGCMATFVFCAMTMQAVGRAAQGMVEEVRRQFQEKPGIMEGTDKPDYERPVAISTMAAQREMVFPSLLGLATPLAVGLVLGVGGVIGLLVGTLSCGFCVAVFMANAGGSWDNAKKYIEADHHGGKGSDAHKAAVVGDTVGDPFKDTSGPSLNILIKLMSIVSVVVAGLVVRYSLAAMGIF
ncbi:MAG: sodium/proton-translocating pyrophosphatase, partial [Pirellulaceae bacterium]|nr:sodium/proton-translocating pyrophosphatase [Pirellulaceae bacterium]